MTQKIVDMVEALCATDTTLHDLQHQLDRSRNLVKNQRHYIDQLPQDHVRLNDTRSRLEVEMQALRQGIQNVLENMSDPD